MDIVTQFSCHKQAIGQNDTVSVEDSDESLQFFNLANSILEERKKTTPVSDLNAAVYLFREALDRQPIPHPLRSASLKDLAAALLMRYSLTSQRQALYQAVEVLSEWPNALQWVVGTGRQSQLSVRAQSESASRLRIYHFHRGILLQIFL